MRMTAKPFGSALLIGAMLTLAVGPADARPKRRAAAVVKLDPRFTRLAGSWQQTRETLSYDASGLSRDMAEMAKMGKASVGQKDESGPFCILPQSVKRDTMMSRLQVAVQFGPEWHVDSAQFGGDQVNFSAHMDTPDQGSGKMSIVGALAAGLTDLTLSTDSINPGGGPGRIRTVSRVVAKRLGACTVDEDVVE